MMWVRRGSYTVEGTVIISTICFIVGLVVLLGFFCHDWAVIKSTADCLAMEGSLWNGRYLQPDIREIDYEAMKQNNHSDLHMLEESGYRDLQSKLFCGKVKDIMVSKSILGREVQVDIAAKFNIFKWEIPCTVSARSIAFFSDDLPRQKKIEQGGEMDEQRKSQE